MEKAKHLAVLLGIGEFKASPGWLQNFKKRHGLLRRNAHGESNSADTSGVELARRAVPKIIEDGNFKPEDVFNFDETGLFTKSRPSASLSTGEYICKSEIHPHQITHGVKNTLRRTNQRQQVQQRPNHGRFVCELHGNRAIEATYHIQS